jgi:hypothetical protein
MRVGQHDIARAAEAADGVAHAIVVVVVEPHARRGQLFEED